MNSITENTKISLSLVVALLGGVGFVTYVYHLTSAIAEEQRKISTRVDALDEMKTDLAVIREKVENIDRRLRK